MKKITRCPACGVALRMKVIAHPRPYQRRLIHCWKCKKAFSGWYFAGDGWHWFSIKRPVSVVIRTA